MPRQSIEDFALKVVFFDLDGVVLDTEPQYTEFWRGICREYFPGRPGLPEEIKGQTLNQICNTYFPDDGTAPCSQAEIRYRLGEFEDGMDFPYVPGVEDFIAIMRGLGLKTAVVTSSDKAKMERVHYCNPELAGMFDHIFTAEDFAESKPSPDCYLRAMAYYGIKPTQCSGYEDSINGLKAMKASGMFTTGVASSLPEDAIRPFCDKVIEDFTRVEWRTFD